MWVVLKEPWCGFQAGHKLSVSDERAWAMLDAGIASEVERPRSEPKHEPAPVAQAQQEAPERKPGRPRKK